jgi:hypothetical protein
MRAFSQSLQGDAKAWFRHLQPQSISSWDELREAFRRFWGEKKSWDLLLSEFYAMRRMKDETISNFSRRFHSHHISINIMQKLKSIYSMKTTQQFINKNTCF